MVNGETQKLLIPKLADKQPIIKPLSYEYIRGLIDGEGCFTFYTGKATRKNGEIRIFRIPAFCIRMHIRDRNLLEMVRQTIGLKDKVYIFKAYRKDGHNRGQSTALTVRSLGALKNKIVPFFYGRLMGFKGKQFNDWLEKIGTDPLVVEEYKLIHRLHKSGYYIKNPKFL